MKYVFRYMVAIPMLAFGFFAAGSPAHAQESGFPLGVAGATWQLLEIQRSSQDVLDTSNVDVTLTFDGQGRATGKSTCNGYSAPYQTGAGQALTFGPVLSTKRACVDASLTNLETEYLGALQGVTSYSFDGANLQLFFNNGGSVLKFGTGTSIVPGMPKTGNAGADYITYMAVGALLALLGTASLLTRQVMSRRGSTR